MRIAELYRITTSDEVRGANQHMFKCIYAVSFVNRAIKTYVTYVILPAYTWYFVSKIVLVIEKDFCLGSLEQFIRTVKGQYNF